LLAFFIANKFAGIFVATSVLVVAVLIALAIGWMVERKLATATLVTGIAGVVFGGLTLALHDERYIKIKVTLVHLSLGLLLLIGLAFGKPLLKPVLGSALQIDDAGWRKLTLRWGLFFFALAGLNELVWRNASTDTWVTFKVFGVIALSVVFLLLQKPLLDKHAIQASE
jgi:intracellular septation protein